MDWLLLLGLGIMWAIFLIPHPSRGKISELERNQTLADIGRQRPGRWVLMPRQDERLRGSRHRAGVRVRERRRRVYAILGEFVVFTGLIGAFPPLRAMWAVTGALLAFGLAYTVALLRVRRVVQRREIELPESDLAVRRRRVSAESLPRQAAAR